MLVLVQLGFRFLLCQMRLQWQVFGIDLAKNMQIGYQHVEQAGLQQQIVLSCRCQAPA